MTIKKSYYDVLDGLRGFAAIVILVFHYFEITYPNDYISNPLGHGFLAVDFFFCLSGFVIGFAYDHRIQENGVPSFFRNRLLRLHPMVVIGTLIGIAGYLFDPWVDRSIFPVWWLILCTGLASMCIMPTPDVPYRAGGLFPYNTPSWSLFYEYIANLLYAFIFSRINRNALLTVTLLSAVWLVCAANQAGWLINGWDVLTWEYGFPRVIFSFTAGLSVYRFGFVWSNRFGLWLPLVLLLSIFFFPHYENDWITESILVIAGFPLIISLGAGAVASGAVKTFCRFIGRLSYPLYMTHITTVWLFTSYYATHHPGGLLLTRVVVTLIVINLLVAYLVMKYIDEPLRNWLRRRLNQ